MNLKISLNPLVNSNRDPGSSVPELKNHSNFHSAVEGLADLRFGSSVFPLDFNSLWGFCFLLDWDCFV